MKHYLFKAAIIAAALFSNGIICIAQTDDFDDGEVNLSPQTEIKEKKSVKASINENPSVINEEEGITLSDFSSFKLHYMADFEHFDKGSYGFGFHILGAGSPFGVSLSLYYNGGIVDVKYATYAFSIGPNVGFNLGDYVALFTPIQGYFGWTGQGGGSSGTAFGWSLGVQPTIAIRLGKVVIYAGVPLSYNIEAEKFGKALELAIGFNI